LYLAGNYSANPSEVRSMSCDHNTSVTMAAGLAKDSYANSYSGPKKTKKNNFPE